MSRATRLLLIAVPAIAGLALPLVWSHPFVLHIAIQALIWALFAASWDLLSGYTGQISFGHAGFFSIGAYTGAVLAKTLALSSWLGLPAAFVLCGVIGLGVGFPALRLRGHYLALVTLGFGEIVLLVATNWESLTGGAFGMHDFGTFTGVAGDPLHQRQLSYVIVAAIALAGLAVLLWIT
ncbi:MAG: branched-chain amino acid ABC transporter permease, partial [Alphaproteobacteria bacterium]|nr:branched-chain amino acid ABC transporter permease [Alphaproteobacteria bacterium]